MVVHVGADVHIEGADVHIEGSHVPIMEKNLKIFKDLNLNWKEIF